jgi:methylaspartate ammonia-lyase
MRTTVDLPPAVHHAAKVAAAEDGTSVSAFITHAVEGQLQRRTAAAKHPPLRIDAYGSGGVFPGIDLNDNAALEDRMDGL